MAEVFINFPDDLPAESRDRFRELADTLQLNCRIVEGWQDEPENWATGPYTYPPPTPHLALLAERFLVSVEDPQVELRAEILGLGHAEYGTLPKDIASQVAGLGKRSVLPQFIQDHRNHSGTIGDKISFGGVRYDQVNPDDVPPRPSDDNSLLPYTLKIGDVWYVRHMKDSSD